MSYLCHQCGNSVSTEVNETVARRSECAACSADLHCCKNCFFYDPNSYNECRESQAERVVDKERSNFCDYFQFLTTDSNRKKGADPKNDARKKLDDLFK